MFSGTLRGKLHEQINADKSGQREEQNSGTVVSRKKGMFQRVYPSWSLETDALSFTWLYCCVLPESCNNQTSGCSILAVATLRNGAAFGRF